MESMSEEVRFRQATKFNQRLQTSSQRKGGGKKTTSEKSKIEWKTI
jgi:hypothetical protein